MSGLGNSIGKHPKRKLEAPVSEKACVTQVCHLLAAGQWTSPQSHATPQQPLPSPTEVQAMTSSLQHLIQLKQAGNE